MRSGPITLPEITPPFCASWKDSRKISGKQRSEFHLEDLNGSSILSFSIEHNPKKGYPSGSFCKWVKQGFPLAVGEKIAVKKSNPNLPLKTALLFTMRDSVFNRVKGDVAVPFVYDEGVYLAMKYCEGKTLADAQADHKKPIQSMPVEDRLKYVADLLKDLTALHDLDCIHRDIKPGNIMIANDSAKLIDLAGAFMEGEFTPFTSFTFPFLNREHQQLFNQYGTSLDSRNVFTKKSDIYALGISLAVLYSDLFTLNNYPPRFKDFDRTCVITATKTDKARHVHNPLASFIISLLKNECKYQSAREVLTEFVKLCQAEYRQDFSAALKPTNSMTKENLKDALAAIPESCENAKSDLAAYIKTPANLKRRLCQPKATIPIDVLFSNVMQQILVEIDPCHYRQVFENISNTTASVRPATPLMELYERTLLLLPDQNKFPFLSASLRQLGVMSATQEQINNFWIRAVNGLGKAEPSVKGICELIKVCYRSYTYLIPEVMKKFSQTVMGSEDNIRAVFDALLYSDRASIYQLYQPTLGLSSHIKLIMLSCLDALQRTDAIMKELRQTRQSADQAAIILRYIRVGIIDLSDLPELVVVLGRLSAPDFCTIVHELREKFPIRDSLSRHILELISVLSFVNASAAFRIFYDYLCPSSLMLSQVITPAQIAALERGMDPRNKEDLFAMIHFFGQMNNFPAITRKMQSMPLSSEDKVSLARTIPSGMCVAFYDLYVSADDLRGDNIIPLISRLEPNHRLTFLLKHATKVKALTARMSEEDASLFRAGCLEMSDYVDANNLTIFVSLLNPIHRAPFILSHLNLIGVNADLRPLNDYLDDVTSNFLSARQQILKRLNGYTADKAKLHDRRVAFIIDKVSHAQSLSELAAIINGNSFDAASGQRHQFEGRAPTHKLFSYGFSDLLKSCLTVLEELPRPSMKEQEFGFHLL